MLLIPIITSIVYLTIPTVRVIILTIGACEARLGLSILVIMSRSYGSDLIKSVSTNKC